MRNKLQLRVVVPEQILVNQPADKIIAEAPNGFFCLKPRHIDFTSALQPGILYYYQDGRESVMAVDEGILVKCGQQVLVSVRNAIAGDNLEYLEQQVGERFLSKTAMEETARRVLRNMEADLIRRFIELEKEYEMA